jgi:hypothetical protein
LKRPILTITKRVYIEGVLQPANDTPPGAGMQSPSASPAVPTTSKNFRKTGLKSNPPRNGNPMREQPRQSGICETCFKAFTSKRPAWMLRYSGYPAKRFCSEKCRKVEEGRRHRRKQAAHAF